MFFWFLETPIFFLRTQQHTHKKKHTADNPSGATFLSKSEKDSTCFATHCHGRWTPSSDSFGVEIPPLKSDQKTTCSQQIIILADSLLRSAILLIRFYDLDLMSSEGEESTFFPVQVLAGKSQFQPGNKNKGSVHFSTVTKNAYISSQAQEGHTGAARGSLSSLF